MVGLSAPGRLVSETAATTGSASSVVAKVVNRRFIPTGYSIVMDSYGLVPGVPHKLDAAVTRVIAPNAGTMTGPGTNTYLVGEGELIVVDPGPDDELHMQAILR